MGCDAPAASLRSARPECSVDAIWLIPPTNLPVSLANAQGNVTSSRATPRDGVPPTPTGETASTPAMRELMSCSSSLLLCQRGASRVIYRLPTESHQLEQAADQACVSTAKESRCPLGNRGDHRRDTSSHCRLAEGPILSSRIGSRSCPSGCWMRISATLRSDFTLCFRGTGSRPAPECRRGPRWLVGFVSVPPTL